MRTLAALLAATVVAVSSTSLPRAAASDPCAKLYRSQQLTLGGSSATPAILADLNQDGRLDLAVVDPIGHTARVGYGNGALGFASVVAMGAGLRPHSIVVADVDKNGSLDLVVADGSGKIIFCRAKGDLTFSPPQSVPVASEPWGVAVADVNGDGYADVVCSSSTAGRLNVLLGSAPAPTLIFTAQFLIPIGTASSHPTYLVLGDFDGDGIQDVAATLAGDHAIAIARGTGSAGVGDGHFTPYATFSIVGTPQSLAFVDVDGDGLKDLMYSTDSSVGYLKRLAPGGTPDGSFAMSSWSGSFSPADARGVDLADVDLDGVPDLVVCRSTLDSLEVFIARTSAGIQTGEFSASLEFLIPAGSAGIAVGNIAEDSLAEFVVGSSTASQLTVLVRQCLPLPPPPPPPPPDPGPLPSVPLWARNGVPICTAPGDQRELSGIDDCAHGAYFVWRDQRNGDYDIYALRMGPDGLPAAGWNTNGNVVCAAPGDQTLPQSVPDNLGGLFVLWEDTAVAFGNIHLQHVLSNGTVAPGWPIEGRVLCAQSSQHAFAAKSDLRGGVVLKWEDQRSGGRYQYYVLRLGPDGLPVSGWSECGIKTTNTFENDATSNYVSVFGSLAMSWAEGAWSSDGFGAQCFGPYEYCPDQSFHWQATLLYVAPGIVSNFAGGAEVYAYPYLLLEDGVGGFTKYYDKITRFGYYDHPSWVSTLPFGNLHGQMADGRGGQTLWGLLGGVKVWAMKFQDDGNPALGWTWPGRPISSTNGTPRLSLATDDGSGGGLYAWEDSRAYTGQTTLLYDLYATWILANGSRAPGWTDNGDPICTIPADRQLCTVVGNRKGNAIVGWRDNRRGEYDLYAYRITTDLPVPALASLVSLAADPQVVRLVWQLASAQVPQVAIERAEAQGEWVTLASVEPDGSGILRYEDRAIEPGHRYGYRLRIGSELLPDSWVDVPAEFEFAVGVQGANPVVGDLNVSYSLAHDARARLQVIDVAGRVLLSRDISATAGRHSMTLASRAELAPGVYTLRFEAAGRATTRRVVVVH